jgi:hypothetical protein
MCCLCGAGEVLAKLLNRDRPMARYIHLKKGGALVKVGNTIRQSHALHFAATPAKPADLIYILTCKLAAPIFLPPTMPCPAEKPCR